MDNTEKIGLSLGCTYVVVSTVAAIVLHVVTAYMVYSYFGFFWAVIGFLCPVVSEVFMLVQMWNEFGFANWYTLCFSIVAFLDLLPRLAAIIGRGKDD